MLINRLRLSPKTEQTLRWLIFCSKSRYAAWILFFEHIWLSFLILFKQYTQNGHFVVKVFQFLLANQRLIRRLLRRCLFTTVFLSFFHSISPSWKIHYAIFQVVLHPSTDGTVPNSKLFRQQVVSHMTSQILGNGFSQDIEINGSITGGDPREISCKV